MTNTENNYQDNDYSVKSLKVFLKIAGNTGIMNKSTAQAKISTVDIMLIRSGILDESQKADIRKINLEYVFKEFRNLNPDKYPKQHTWGAYCSRVRSSINLFKKHNGQFSNDSPDSSRQTIEESRKPSPKKDIINNNNLFTFDLQIPIRKGEHMVKISSIPNDIGESDIRKISAVILAYANT